MCGRRKELVPLADRFTKKLIGEEFGRLGCSMVEIKMIAMKSTSAKGSYLKRIVMLSSMLCPLIVLLKIYEGRGFS